jgi:hypothetical protein
MYARSTPAARRGRRSGTEGARVPARGRRSGAEGGRGAARGQRGRHLSQSGRVSLCGRSKAGCSMMALKSWVPRSALVSGRWPRAAASE